ncbi:MAG TPA: hypothetical protein VFR34_02235 [Paracoccaceae bacterium]|nr:hypothetical protein [Paracoccaceae bacterium]
MQGGLFREPALILLVFAAGFAWTVFGALLAPSLDQARAVYSIWPALLLGGIAAERFLRMGPWLEGTGWLGWWAAGLLAYVIHLGFGYGVVFGFSFGAALESQGTLTVTLNFALLAAWALSVAAACVPKEPRWERALHALATLLLIVTALGSTLRLGVNPVSNALGAGLLVLWLHALWRRYV